MRWRARPFAGEYFETTGLSLQALLAVAHWTTSSQHSSHKHTKLSNCGSLSHTTFAPANKASNDNPSVFESLHTASRLLFSDGGATYSSHFQSFFESNDSGVRLISRYFSLPRWFKFLHWAFVKYLKRDEIWAALIKGWSPISSADQWKLVSKREVIRAEWHKFWDENELDFIICVPNALPAVPHGGIKNEFTNCSYTLIWNLVYLSPLATSCE